MQAIVLVGIQAVGKTSFFKERFFETHVRINLDMLRTRHRERLLVEACLAAKQPFVADNTHASIEARQRYIHRVKAARFEIVGYYFQSKLRDAIARNAQRSGKARIRDAGLRATYAKLEIPTRSEGFDQLFYVELSSVDGGFSVKEWEDEI